MNEVTRLVPVPVYQMVPRSWRPDSSLGDKVEDSAVVGFLDDQGVRDGVREFYSSTADEPTEDPNSTTVSFSLQNQPPHSQRE